MSSFLGFYKKINGYYLYLGDCDDSRENYGLTTEAHHLKGTPKKPRKFEIIFVLQLHLECNSHSPKRIFCFVKECLISELILFVKGVFF